MYFFYIVSSDNRFIKGEAWNNSVKNIAPKGESEK